jgi:hypothetical protein
VPEAGVTALRTTLDGSKYMHASTWSPLWWLDDGSTFLTTMRRDTTHVWTAAMGAARSRAEGEMTAWSHMEMEFGSYVPAASAKAASGWEAQLEAATTPAALDALATSWTGAVTAASKAATLDQITVATGGYGGVAPLVAAAEQRVSVARGDNLDLGAVPSLIATLTASSSDAATTLTAIKSLEADLTSLNALISLDGRVVSELRSLDSRVVLATAHNAAGSSGFAGQYVTLSAQLHDAGTAAGLNAVAAKIVTVEDSVNAALTAVGCGHDVPNGKVIDVDLSTQGAVFFDDGCVAGESLVTTGRAGLRTPTGTFHIYRKVSPITLISPWPKSSPYYYTPENAEYAMEFLGGGFFIHDAPWEPNTAFGPGSQNGVDASHGCVHMPSTTMAWLYSWAPIGATVIIHY